MFGAERRAARFPRERRCHSINEQKQNEQLENVRRPIRIVPGGPQLAQTKDRKASPIAASAIAEHRPIFAVTRKTRSIFILVRPDDSEEAHAFHRVGAIVLLGACSMKPRPMGFPHTTNISRRRAEPLQYFWNGHRLGDAPGERRRERP
jgi:hypothetical protein